MANSRLILHGWPTARAGANPGKLMFYYGMIKN